MKRTVINVAVSALHAAGLLWTEAFCAAYLIMDPYWTAKDSIALILTATVFLLAHYTILRFCKQRELLFVPTTRTLSWLDYGSTALTLILWLIPNPILSPVWNLYAFIIISIQLVIILCRVLWNRWERKSDSRCAA